MKTLCFLKLTREPHRSEQRDGDAHNQKDSALVCCVSYNMMTLVHMHKHWMNWKGECKPDPIAQYHAWAHSCCCGWMGVNPTSMLQHIGKPSSCGLKLDQHSVSVPVVFNLNACAWLVSCFDKKNFCWMNKGKCLDAHIHLGMNSTVNNYHIHLLFTRFTSLP